MIDIELGRIGFGAIAFPIPQKVYEIEFGGRNGRPWSARGIGPVAVRDGVV